MNRMAGMALALRKAREKISDLEREVDYLKGKLEEAEMIV